MSEEEKLEAIRQEAKEAKKEIWWLSTFLVKIPLFIGCLLLIVFATKDCKSSEKVLSKTELDLIGSYRGVDTGQIITFLEDATYEKLNPSELAGVDEANKERGTWRTLNQSAWLESNLWTAYGKYVIRTTNNHTSKITVYFIIKGSNPTMLEEYSSAAETFTKIND